MANKVEVQRALRLLFRIQYSTDYRWKSDAERATREFEALPPEIRDVAIVLHRLGIVYGTPQYYAL